MIYLVYIAGFLIILPLLTFLLSRTKLSKYEMIDLTISCGMISLFWPLFLLVLFPILAVLATIGAVLYCIPYLLIEMWKKVLP